MTLARFRPIGLVLAVLALAALAVVSGCRRQNDPRNVSGRVTVEGGDADSVIVELYSAPVPENNVVWETTQQRPTVGFPYSLAMAFDFRRERIQSSVHTSTLVGTVVTGGDGRYEFADVDEAAFVIVVRKSGFGWSAPLAVDTRNGNADVATISLYPEQVYRSGLAITGTETWLAGHHYVVAAQTSLSLNAGATLTVAPGAFVRLGNLSEFKVRGTLICEGTADEPIIFTTSDIENPTSAAGWQYIHFFSNATPPRFRYCSFTYTDQAILSDKPGGRVEYCYFNEIGAEAVVLSGNPTGADADSVVFRGNVVDHISTGLRLHDVWGSGLSIDHNVFALSARFGLDMKLIRGGEVFCNWFVGCGRRDTLSSAPTGAIQLENVQGMRLTRDEFVSNFYGVILGSYVDSTTHIQNCRFTRSFRALYVYFTNGESGPSYPDFNFNCIEQNEEYALDHTACLINTQVLDATNNFWNSTSESDIRTRAIRDCEDDALCPCDEFIPYLLTCPGSETGICR